MSVLEHITVRVQKMEEDNFMEGIVQLGTALCNINSPNLKRISLRIDGLLLCSPVETWFWVRNNQTLHTS
jgi:hypothetical protein